MGACTSAPRGDGTAPARARDTRRVAPEAADRDAQGTWRLKRSKRAVLAIDGGGLRGVIALCVLEVLEDELRKQSGIPDLMIGEAFDIIAGTSTGAILASYLTAYKCDGLPARENELARRLDGSARMGLEMYRSLAPTIFPPAERRGTVTSLLFGPRFNAGGIDKALASVFDHALSFKRFAKVKTENEVASLMIVSFDMVHGRPCAFVGDRRLRTFEFVRLDPFITPFLPIEDGVSDKRLDVLRARLESMPAEHRAMFGEQGMNLFNVGDSDFVGFVLSKEEQTSGNATADAEALVAERLQARRASANVRSGDCTKRIWAADADTPVWHAIRCSSAAPTFFPPARIKDFYIADDNGERMDLVCTDGGVAANNPAAIALQYLKARDGSTATTAASASRHPLEDYVVLSIGCGAMYGLQDANKSGEKQSTLDWILGDSSIIQILMNNLPALAHADLDARYSQMAQQLGQERLSQYLRIQLAIDKLAQPGEAGYAPKEVVDAVNEIDNPNNVEKMVKVGRAFAELYRPLIADFVGRYLVEPRAAAAPTPTPPS